MELLNGHTSGETRSRLPNSSLLRAIGSEHQQAQELLELTRQCDVWSRYRSFSELARQLRIFVDCQEAGLYPMCQERPELSYLVDDARGLHRFMLRNLRELERKRPDELLWETTFERLYDAVSAYLEFELTELLPRVHQVLDSTALTSIERRFAGRRLALTRRSG